MSASRISLKDSYYLYRGASNLFCLQGYSPPRTQLLKGKSLALQTAKKCELFPAIKNKGRDPSPVDYADGQEKWLKSTWLKPTGKFLPSKRETMTEKCMKASLKSPGPGAYSPSPTQISRTLGKFKYLLNSKGDSRTLLNNTQALAEEVPGPNEYYKILADRDKAVKKI